MSTPSTSGGPPTAVLQRRLRAAMARLLVRRWELRQRHAAKGAWDRLRRALCDAALAYAAPAEVADEIEAEGLAPLPAGLALEPPRRIFFLPRARVARLPRLRPVPVRLSAQLLSAPAVVLVSFDEVAADG